MNNDFISRKYVVRELLKERERYPAMVAERYSFGVKLPHSFNQAMRGGIRKGLRIAETAPAIDAVEVVRCRDCEECAPWCDDKNDAHICGRAGFFTNPNDFCSRGVRKKNAEVEG